MKEQVIELIHKTFFFSEEEKNDLIDKLPDDIEVLSRLKDKLKEKIDYYENNQDEVQKKMKKYITDLEAYKNKSIQIIIKKAEERERESDEELDSMLDDI